MFISEIAVQGPLGRLCIQSDLDKKLTGNENRSLLTDKNQWNEFHLNVYFSNFNEENENISLIILQLL